MYVVVGWLSIYVFDEHRCLMLPEERTAAALSAAALACTISNNLVRMALTGPPLELRFAVTSIQAISLASKLVMVAEIAVPVVVDPVTGCRVHLFRLIELVFLAYGLTLVSEVVSAQYQKDGCVRLHLFCTRRECALT
jgi:hypothetical protein